MARFAVSCGGTGGHVFPGVATAQALRKRGHDVLLLLAGRSVEAAARFAWDGPVLNTGAAEIPLHPARFLPGVMRFLRAYLSCARAFRRQRPAALLAMGSYSSAGPVLAAATLRIPVVLHEANVIPGKATTAFARLASSIAVSFPETSGYLPRRHCVTTGLPLRKELEQAAAAPILPPAAPTLLAMGGSQGAQRLNELIPEAVARLRRAGLPLEVIHLAGERNRPAVEQRYAALDIPAEVHGFCRDMAAVYRRATFAISRSGANSCMELAAFGVPALLVPYPRSARDHQAANARAMALAGAADVVEQAALGPDTLSAHLSSRLADPRKCQSMRDSALQRALAGADDKLADLVEQTAVPR